MALVGHYQFEENSGSRIDIINAYDLDEITNDSVAAVPGVIGNALNANAAFGHVSKSITPPVWEGSATGFSYSLWVLFNQANANLEMIMRLGGGAGGRLAQVRRATSGRLGTEVRDTVNTYAPTSNSVDLATPSVWHHVACAYIGNSTFDTYINNVLDSSLVTADLPMKSMGVDSLVRVGANTDGSQAMDGAVDDLRFYNHKLSAGEVNALFNIAPAANSPRRRSSNGWYRSSS